MTVRWTPAKVVVFVLLLAFYASVLTHKINLPAADDLPRQIQIGETVLQGNLDILYENIYSYAEPYHRFYNHHWFSGVIFYLLFQVVGWGGLVIAKVAIFLAAFTLVFFTALRKADFWLVALVACPALIVISSRTGLRPEVFSYLFVATYLFLLTDLDDHPERRWVFWLIPLQLLWVNMHVFFSIGIMMVAGFLFEKIVHNWKGMAWWRNPLVRKLIVVLLGVSVISLINPRGISGVFYRYPPDFPILISENQSVRDYVRHETSWDDPSIAVFRICVFVLMVSFVIAFRAKRLPIFYFLAGIATTVLGFHILRSLSLFGLIFLPAFSANLAPAWAALRRRLAQSPPRFSKALRYAGIIACMGIAIFWFGPVTHALTKYKQRGIGLVPWAEASATFFKENNLQGPIFNDADIGSYLIYELYPQERVFTDNRFGDGYSASFYADVLLPALIVEDAWKQAMETYDFNTIFYYHYDAATGSRNFLWQRAHDPEWALVYADPLALIYVRNTPENAEIIAQHHITPENAEERLAQFITSPSFGDRTGAGDLLNIVGRPDLARKIFLEVVMMWPDRGRIWSVLGQMARDENTEASTVLALMFFERALQEGRATAETYGFIGDIYVRMGQTEKAVEALRKSLSMNPADDGVRDLLRSITTLQPL